MLRALLFTLLLAACAHQPVVSVSAPPPPALPWYGDLHALAAEAAAVRGLALTQPFEVVVLADADFFTERARVEPSAPPLTAEVDATLREFSGLSDVAPALASRDSREVRDEQVLAFYDFATHRLFVRTQPPPLATGPHLHELAHEVGHVLQDQLGAGARVPTTFEAAVAQRAVLEGDATLTATLVEAQRQGLTATRAVERARVTLSTLSPRELAEASGVSPALLDAPPVVRELFVFPYFHGQRFVFDLYQAGGEALVRAAVLEPPTRTDALHAPQRWLDGSARLEPVGGQPRRLGLFLTRLLLAHCEARNPKAAQVGRWLEAHYVDDSFHRAGSMLSWATTWDTAPQPVDAALEREAGGKDLDPQSLTWSNERLRALVPGVVLGCLGAPLADLDVQVRGEVVGAVLHAPSADRERVVSRVARTALTRDEPRSLRAVIEPALADRAWRQLGPGTLRGARWSHEQLGLSLTFAEGAVVEDPRVALAVAGAGAGLTLTFLDDTPTPRAVEGPLNARLAAVNPDAPLAPLRHSWTPRPGGGHETRAELDGPLALHAVLVPVCDGTATALLVGTAQHPSGQALVERWLASLTIAASRCP